MRENVIGVCLVWQVREGLSTHSTTHINIVNSLVPNLLFIFLKMVQKLNYLHLCIISPFSLCWNTGTVQLSVCLESEL